MEEEAKAVQKVAEFGGKALDAAREAGGFVARFVAGPLEQGMGIFEDRLKYMRWERQVRFMQRADEFLKRQGLTAPTRPVPLKLAIPFMQGASLEDDDELQDRWAALLVNAANAQFAGDVRRSFGVMLEQLTPADAKILEVLYSVPYELWHHDGLATANLPASVHVAPDEGEQALSPLPAPPDSVVMSLSNLARLGCLRPEMSWGGGESFARVSPTIAGRAFVEACRIPAP